MTDILDRSDRSLSPVNNKHGAPALVSKRRKHDWSQGGKPGEFCMIAKEALHIDDRYQRDTVSDDKVRQIARNWDWVLLGVILVVQRQDDTFWVFDGGHRTRAAFYRDDIHLLPCMVYSIRELSDEAKAFLGKNLMTTNVSSVDKYKAAVVANDETANKAAKLLEDFGIEVAKNANKPSQIKCINTLLSMLERDEALARRCFVFCLRIADGGAVSSTVMRGLFALCERFSSRVDILERWGEKLSRHSQREIDVRIRQMRAECGKGGEKVEALAILAMINKGCKNKLTW